MCKSDLVSTWISLKQNWVKKKKKMQKERYCTPFRQISQRKKAYTDNEFLQRSTKNRKVRTWMAYTSLS